MKNDLPDQLLNRWGQKHNGYGIEAVFQTGCRKGYWGDVAFLYVNMGDTYTRTLVYLVDEQKFRFWSMGDTVEYLENLGVNIK